VRAQYYPSLDGAATPSLIAGGISARGFSSKPAVYRNEAGERSVLFVGNRTGYSNVFSVPVDSLYRPVGDPRVLIPGERSSRFEAFHLFESRMSVSEQGQLAFVTQSGERDVIHVYDIEADEVTETYSFDDLTAVYSPTWSPDGRKIAFTAIEPSGFTDLHVYDRDTGVLQRLTNDFYDDRDPSWSPDGRYLVFSSDRTSVGKEDAYNLFVYDLSTQHVRYLTYGDHHDLSPSWTPDGQRVVFTSTRPDSSGVYSGQDVWIIDAADALAGTSDPIASLDPEPATLRPDAERTMHRLTRLTTAVYDPVWTEDDRLVFAAMEGFSFSVRTLGGLDSLRTKPVATEKVRVDSTGSAWTFERRGQSAGDEQVKYKKRYQLDIAQSQLSQNPVWGTQGGAFIALSDMMGDDYYYFTLFSNSRASGDFLETLNFSVSRLQLNRRTNTSYGIYRYAGLRYDITEPLADSSFPLFFETVWGGYGAMSYPISKFRRVELGTSLSWSDKEVTFRNLRRQALLLSNSVSLVHDNALYYYNGPIEGWRGNLTLAYTTDIRFSNVSYYTVSADVRKYWRPLPSVTFAQRAQFQMNQGREARLFFLGGSWDLRGYPFWDVRGRKMWFTSHELRVPIVDFPGRYVPILAPFGIVNLKGAAFFDAAHAWNFGYNDREPELFTGDTIGSAGIGLRMNMFGGLVLRYDIGYRFSNGLKDWDDERFGQFFFGWDF
ncbi:MAG: BamA/TamA family outer membrane protein, partial [Bacteroidota bacterium]